jgi:cell division septation protein DedD
MLRTSEGDTEILLGNKQLLGIFFVVAVLLGIAFYGGYAVGHASSAKKSIPGSESPSLNGSATATGPVTGGETHNLPADGTSTDQIASSDVNSPSAGSAADVSPHSEPPPLGASHKKAVERTPSGDVQPDRSQGDTFAPSNGEQFLQVAAVSRDEAKAVADALRSKGFRAHAVPKPGTQKIYRVLIGPVKDAADLSSTRDALRQTGFREVIVQRY